MFRTAIVTAVVLVMSATLGKAETSRDVFVLSIGSGDYAEAENSGAFAFADNDAAYLGAQRVARIFRDGGARHVLQLLGRDGEYLSATDIYTAIDDIAVTARDSGAADPILVVYFSGHGFSESLGYILFLAPGDLIIPRAALDPSKILTTVLDVEGVGVRAPTALSLKERLDKIGIPYFLILDTCFETDANLDLEALRLVSEQAAELTHNVSDIIRFLSLPREPHPVVFSAPPGTLAFPDIDPIEGKNFIAPMARRLVLAAQMAEPSGETLDLAELVRALTINEDKFGDSPGVTWFDGSFETGSILVPGANVRASMDRRRGTAYAARPCCQDGVSDPAADEETVTWAVEGEVAFRPDGEDFVTGGEPFDARFEANEVTVWEVTTKSLNIDVELEDGRWFSLALSVPGEAFAPGLFAHVQRHGFTEADRPGMYVSIKGSACSEVAGTFELISVSNDKGGALRTLDVELQQFCDGSSGALVGSARLSFMATR